MKTISEQLKDLGLSHGDLCEIEGVEGRLIVLQEGRDLHAETADDTFTSNDYANKVTCGWKANSSHITAMLGDLAIYYTKVLPKTSPKPLPEAVEKVVREADWLDSTKDLMRDFARAILDEAAKPKGTIVDIIGANPVYGPKRN